MRTALRTLRVLLVIGAGLVLGVETAYVVLSWFLRLKVLRILSDP